MAKTNKRKVSVEEKKRTTAQNTSASRGGAARGTKTATPKTSSASRKADHKKSMAARGLTAKRIDMTADGKLATAARTKSGTKTATPKSSARANVGDAYIARDGVRNTLTGELISKPKSNGKRFLPVDHGAVSGLPAGATSAKYDSYTGKYVPVYTSGSKKKK